MRRIVEYKKITALLLTMIFILCQAAVIVHADTVRASDFQVTYTEDKVNDYWTEYYYTVKNDSSQPVTGVIILIPADGDMQKCETWSGQMLSYDASAGGILLYAPVSIAAGGSASLEKMGIDAKTHPVTLGKPSVYAVNETRNWNSVHQYGDPPEDNTFPDKDMTDGGNAGNDMTGPVLETDYELKGEVKDMEFKDTPVGKHGKLHLAKVEGYGNAPVIVDEKGEPLMLRGASTHGLQWDVCIPYINKEAFQSFRDEWGVNLIRFAGYVRDDNGYLNGGRDVIDDMITKGMSYTKELGLYAIIDWHVLAYNPHDDKEEAKKFFEKYAGMYSGYDNVIYEICNEPTGTPWYDGTGRDLYSYANELIPIIREKDPDALIVVGTNTWSQDVDDVHNKPIEGYDNIMYAFHFYSGSHKGEFRDRVKNALDAGTPVFITEFGICDASGNGNIQTGEADLWMEFCEKYNISHACWAISKKDESASYFKTDCVRTSGWKQEDLAPTGVWLFNTYRREASSEQDDTAETTAPAESAPGFFERIIDFFRNLFAGVSAQGVAS